MRDQSRQCAEGDQPAAGGTFALVDALSLLNPDALEFSALALMLLASQGGFEVKTAIADAGVPSCLFLEMFNEVCRSSVVCILVAEARCYGIQYMC
jgi:hypothetical protein